MDSKNWDVFVSYASSDGKRLAEVLARALTKQQLNVWFDGFCIKIGDDIPSSISEGMRGSKSAVIVFTKDYFESGWTKRELNVFINFEITIGYKIFPVFHEVSPQEVARREPLISGNLGMKSDVGVEEIAAQIAVLLNPVESPPPGCAPSLPSLDSQPSTARLLPTMPGFQSALSDSQRLEIIKRFAGGPAVYDYLIPNELIEEFTLAYNPGASLRILKRINAIRKESDPQKRIFAIGIPSVELPDPEKGLLAFWQNLFDLACQKGPRTLVTVLLFAPEGISLNSLLQKL